MASKVKRRKVRSRSMVAAFDSPPEPVQSTTLRQVPILYNADTGQKVGGRFQRWANGYALPGQMAVKVRLGRMPTSSSGGGEPAGVMYDEKLGQDVMYFDPKYFSREWMHRREVPRAGREAMYDELTHLADRSGKLPDWVKQRFQQVMTDPRSWRPAAGAVQANSPHEQFSEAAVGYLMGYKRPSDRWTGGYGFSPTPYQWRQLRGMFRNYQQ